MAEPHSSSRSILLIGRSLYLVAVEAGLRAEPGMIVQRAESWQPLLQHGAQAPDALIVDSMSTHAEAIAALTTHYPELLVIELSPNDLSLGRATVWYGQQRTVGSAQDLARLIQSHGNNR